MLVHQLCLRLLQVAEEEQQLQPAAMALILVAVVAVAVAECPLVVGLVPERFLAVLPRPPELVAAEPRLLAQQELLLLLALEPLAELPGPELLCLWRPDRLRLDLELLYLQPPSWPLDLWQFGRLQLGRLQLGPLRLDQQLLYRLQLCRQLLDLVRPDQLPLDLGLL